MPSEELICVCDLCGQAWEGLYVEWFNQCEACGGVVSTKVTEDDADVIAASFADKLTRYERRRHHD